MVDRLRAFFTRPLRDGDRLRLFAIVVALIVGVAFVLSVFDDAGHAPQPTRQPRPAHAAPTPTAAAFAPVSTPQAPSEEGEPPAELQATTADIARSKHAARRFLSRYLPFAYGRGRASRLPAATPELRTELARRQPRVPATERRRRPRLELLQSNGVSRERAELVALVRDSERRYSVQLQLANTPSGWLVTGLGS